MRIAKILPSPDKNDKLLILIHNGTNEVLLRANTIKEMVDWSNALVNTQKRCVDGRYDHLKAKTSTGSGMKSPGKTPSESGRYSVAESINGDRYSIMNAGGSQVENG